MDLILQFSTEPSIGSAIIRWGTHCPYSHVDGVMPDGNLLGCRLGLLTAEPPGVQIRPPNYTTFSATQRMAFPVDATKCFDIAKTYIGDSYSWEEDVGYVIPWFWKHIGHKAFNCSSFWHHVMKQAGLAVFDAPEYSVSPRDLLYSPLAKAV